MVPRANGAGTVAVYLWGEGAAPSSELIAQVKADLESQREIGVTVTVQAASQVPMNIPVQIKLPEEVELDWATQQIKAAVKGLFDSLDVGEGFQVPDISRAVLNVVPAEKLQYPATLVGIPGMNGVVLRSNSITVEALS